jgi:hypothetical protein
VTTALFVHHSIGRQIIEIGGLRATLGLMGIDLWDHDYNDIGLTDPAGRRAGRAFPVPRDDTDPPGLVALLEGLASGAWDVPDHDVLAIKSCFPNNALATDEAMAAQRDHYEKLLAVASDLGRPVVLISSPPLAVEATSRAAASRATRQAGWLAERWRGAGLGYGPLFEELAYTAGPLRGRLHASHRIARPRDSHLSKAGARAGAAVVATAIGEASRGAAA